MTIYDMAKLKLSLLYMCLYMNTIGKQFKTLLVTILPEEVVLVFGGYKG